MGMASKVFSPIWSAKAEKSATMVSKTVWDQPIRSILFTARMTWRMPSRLTR